MNEKILFIGPLNRVSKFIPRKGNYLYAIKLESPQGHYLKTGKSKWVFTRMKSHKRILPSKLNASITDVLIAGPYEILGIAELILLRNCLDKFKQFNNEPEIFEFNYLLDELIPLIPKDCFDSITINNANWLDIPFLHGYEIDLKSERVRHSKTGKILMQIGKLKDQIMIEKDFKYSIKSLIRNAQVF